MRLRVAIVRRVEERRLFAQEEVLRCQGAAGMRGEHGQAE